ncbi:VanW family protein [Pengzhenrongella frigida]|uniref:Vanomycin resistance protein VanB n=1 Tax=Pengzhenrongella frigida TaxID=1259133 RepID=A0A4Q5N1Q9_9MICO|nr:VanW family protein [Cellulomonas sp. HLT2-17]RYV51986.1 vanomycin resistance protein VanB [Cellulomonas sp. HLT2-17]
MVKKSGSDGDVRQHAADDAAAPEGAAVPPERAAVPTERAAVPGGSPAMRFDPVTRPAEASGDVPSDPTAASPLAIFDEDEQRRRWPRVVLTTLAVVVVLGGTYVGASWALADRVPRGTTVAGVEIGGLDSATAVTTLEDGLADVVGEPIPLVAGEVSTSLAPADAGLVLDADATVRGLTGFDLQPGRLWQHAFGNGEAQPVTLVNDALLADAVDLVAAALVTAPVDAQVVFADSEARATEAVDGAEVDPSAAAELLRSTWLTAARPLELPVRVVGPDISQEEADLALSTLAQPLARAPIAVAVAGQTVELPAAVVTAAASFVAEDSDLTLTLDGPLLVEEIVKRTTGLFTPSADASFAFENGVPVIVPGIPGTTLDPQVLADAVAAAGVSNDRTARVELVASDPAQSTEKLQALGIIELVSEFSTPLTNEPLRTENLRTGATKVNGTLVRPGDTFSLTETLGPITAAAGFNEAWVIVNGEHVKGTGGGLSQMSTTTFNAAYLAGFEDVEHTPHSEWFTRYPEGREATLYSGSIDMKFKNTTPYGALLQSWVADGRLHVAVWGTKYWTVESSTSGRSGVVSPSTVHSASPTCLPMSAGNPGFSVTVTRQLLLNGELTETTKRTTRYKPQNAVVCDPPTG